MRVKSGLDAHTCFNYLLETDFKQARRNTSLSSMSSDILHRLAIRTWAAALKSLSTSAELGIVEFAFRNAHETAGYDAKLSA
jgi:hypothetical protein